MAEWKIDDLFDGRYQLVRLLGAGGSSNVWLANDTLSKSKKKVAVKIYKPGAEVEVNGNDEFANEFDLVSELSHPNLLCPTYYGLCGQTPYLILPYCEKGSTMQFIKPRNGLLHDITETEVWRLLHDVASGLAYLHSQKPKIIHQDVKPDNILISDDGKFMLTDFGISVTIRNTMRKDMLQEEANAGGGTIVYMPPERFAPGKEPIMASDIWALGATVYELMTRKLPFGNEGGRFQELYTETPDPGDKWSFALRQLVMLCLSKEPWDRPRAEKLVEWAGLYLDNRQHELEDALRKAAGKEENRKYDTVKKLDKEDAYINESDGKGAKKKRRPYITVTFIAAAVIALFVWFSPLIPDYLKPDTDTAVMNEPLKPSEYETVMADADRALDKEDYVNARILYEKAYKLAASDAERSEAQNGIDRSIITTVSEALADVPESLTKASEYRAYFDRGEKLFNAERYSEALIEFDKAFKEDATAAEKQAARERIAECNRRIETQVRETQVREALKKANDLALQPGLESLDAAFQYYKKAKDLGSSDRTGYNTYKKKAEELIGVLKDGARTDSKVANYLNYARQLNNTKEIRAMMESLGLNN